MLKKIIEQKRQLNELRKECFEARDQLIVVSNNKTPSNKIGCIRMIYNIECGMVKPWVSGVNPENTYRAVGPTVSYCSSFDPNQPMVFLCDNTSCPMYDKYIEYKNKCSALRAMESNARSAK